MNPSAPASRARWPGFLLWVLAILITLGCISWQDKTGPTYPLTGTVETAKGPVSFKFLRSENIGTSLKVMLLDPVPEGVSGFVRYRRFRSTDNWLEVPMQRGQFTFTRRGRTTTESGVGRELPSLDKRAGKYEYFVFLADGSSQPFSVTGERPIYARYKGAVPMPVLGAHILAIFLSMLIANRTALEGCRKVPNLRTLLWATLGSLLVGAFVLGPTVQWYAFGVWWSGVPFGFDWTDNKVLVELVAWLVAIALNWKTWDKRWPVVAAGVVTLVVYFIPHSIFGSEYDYTRGAGRGTIGLRLEDPTEPLPSAQEEARAAAGLAG